MKKILPLIFMAVLMIVAHASIAAADSTMSFPNGDQMDFLSYLEFDGYDSLAITYASDGSAYATALDYQGLPDFQYYDMVYLTPDGFWYCTSDGFNWFPC